VTEGHLAGYADAAVTRNVEAVLLFECSGDQRPRKTALESLTDQSKTWPLAEPLHVISEAKSRSLVRLLIPAPVFGGDYGALAGLFHGLAASAELRANTLFLLNGVVAPRAFAWWSTRSGTGQQLQNVADCQAAWRLHLDHYLALDAAAGSCAHPDLIRELHIGLPPLEHLVLRFLLSESWTVKLDSRIYLNAFHGFAFPAVPQADLQDALESLAKRGWVEGIVWQTSSGFFLIGRGPLLRKLSRHELLRLGA
jgi:hypothetical protein